MLALAGVEVEDRRLLAGNIVAGHFLYFCFFFVFAVVCDEDVDEGDAACRSDCTRLTVSSSECKQSRLVEVEVSL